MAKVRLNPLLEQIRGQIGDLVFRRYGDGVILTRKPAPSSVPPTAAQLAHRERFREAMRYGKAAAADPEVRPLYEAAARARGQPFFSVTLADFFNAPTVEGVDVAGYTGAVGDPIGIAAADDFEVVRVEVTLTDAGGAVLERGEAALRGPGWVYTARTAVAAGTAVRVEVRAYDRPGGEGAGTAEVTVPG